MTETRLQERKNFLSAHGLGSAEVSFVAGDASFRKYYRIKNGEQTHMLMDAPPIDEDLAPFVCIAHCLLNFGYSAPEIVHMDKECGFLLLGDLGDDSFNILIAREPNNEQMLYENAVDLLVDLQAKTLPNIFAVDEVLKHSLSSYSSEILLREARLLTEWTMTSLDGLSDERDQEFDEIFTPLLERVSLGNGSIILRDYHADNLMWMPERTGLSRVGLLDFQDALIGHPAYDLVSLLQDARRDVPLALEEAMIKRFIDKSNIDDEASFRAAYAILGAQRNAKIIGIFTRLYLRDGKDIYLPLIPRVWALLERNFWLEELEPFKAWVNAHVPLVWRREVITPHMLQEIP
jgi:N-acetylmuramate 1-kinase